MKTNTDPNGNKNNITFRKYEKYGNTYIRARQWVTLIDGTVERLEGKRKKSGRCQSCSGKEYL